MEYKNKKLEKFEKELENKRVAVIGIGVSNIPLIDYLYEKHAKVTVFDNKEKLDEKIMEKIKKYNFEYSLGTNSL